MDGSDDDMALRGRVAQARLATLAWLDSMQVPGEPAGVSRISAAHDMAAWPGMALPGTTNAILCRQLLGGLDGVDRVGVAAWLRRHRQADGVFRIPGMADADVFKRPEPGETWRYIDWHVTNYALGALDAVAPGERAVLAFAAAYLSVPVLKAWLADRDLRDPWLEGNNIVNLGGFLLGLGEQPALAQDAAAAMAALFAWHDYHQEPSTGFWGLAQDTRRGRLHAMAGSMHNFHLWYATGRALPFQDRAVDYALSCPPGIVSACIDVDLVDLLVHAHDRIDHRRAEIRAWLRRLLPALLDWQDPDGGFCDERHGIRRQDGWVGGYSEPQGISNSFATWFRWIAIAMIHDLLWPGAASWQFRRGVGIGYRGRPA